MNITIVQAMDRDFSALLVTEALAARSRLYSPYSVSSLRRLLAEDGGTIYKIVVDDTFAGSASVEIEDDWIELGSIVVRERFQGCGVGREAFRQRLELLKRRGYRKFRCHVHPDNTASLRLHMQFGMSAIERIDDKFGDGEPRLLLEMCD